MLIFCCCEAAISECSELISGAFFDYQAQIGSEEAITIGDLQCTKVSAELKSARSVVRITEITATLQEQK